MKQENIDQKSTQTFQRKEIFDYLVEIASQEWVRINSNIDCDKKNLKNTEKDEMLYDSPNLSNEIYRECVNNKNYGLYPKNSKIIVDPSPKYIKCFKHKLYPGDFIQKNKSYNKYLLRARNTGISQCINKNSLYRENEMKKDPDIINYYKNDDYVKYILTSKKLKYYYQNYGILYQDKTKFKKIEVNIKNLQRYKCTFPLCSKGFPTFTQTKRHFMSHTELRPFRCINKGCLKSFSRLDNMKIHAKKTCKYGEKKNIKN